MTRNLLMSAAVALACVSAAFAQKAAEEKAAPAEAKRAVENAVLPALPLVPAQQIKVEAVKGKDVAPEKGKMAAPPVVEEVRVIRAQNFPPDAVIAVGRPVAPAQKVAVPRDGKAVDQPKGKAEAKVKVEVRKEAVKAAAPAVRVMPAMPVEAIDVQFFNGQMVRRPNQPSDPLAVALQSLARANPNAIDPQTSQFMLQYRSLLMAEYASLVAACQPDKDQRRAIARAGEAALVRYCESLTGQNRNRLMRNGKFPQVRDYFVDTLTQAACANLTPKQVARYVEEVESRKAYRSDAVFKGAVAVLDYRLYLTPEQREKIEAKLRSEWKDHPEPEALQYYFNQPNSYVPNFPPNLIEPELDDDQKLVYKSIQKVSFGHGFAMNERGDLPLEDAELPPYAVRMPEPRQPQNGAVGLGGAIFRRVQQGLRGD